MSRIAAALTTTLWVALGTIALAGPASGGPSEGPTSHDLVVFEAASLKDAFASLAARFEKEHPGVHVVTNAAGSQELRAQIEHGAAADVFASADERHMGALVAAGLTEAPALFACNEPVIVTRNDLASSVKTFADLPRADRIVVGAPEVPIGAYTARILKQAAAKLGMPFATAVEAKIVSRELNVRQVLAKVVLGEADAAIVYRTDALAAKGKIRVVEIPPDLNVTAAYPIAALKHAPSPKLAAALVALVRSPAGTAVLREAGFVPCPAR